MPIEHGQHRDLGQHRRAEAGEPLVDERRQHEIVARECRGSAGMPKLPRQETKQSATPARSGGVISGRTMVRSTRQRPRAAGERRLDAAPAASARSPARSVRNTSGAYWTPSSRMMPPRRIERIARSQRRREPSMRSGSGSTGRTSAATRARRPAARASTAARSRRRTRCGARMSVRRRAAQRAHPRHDGERGAAERRHEAVCGRRPRRRARQHARPGPRRETRRPEQRLPAGAAQAEALRVLRQPRRAAPTSARSSARSVRRFFGHSDQAEPNMSAKRFLSASVSPERHCDVDRHQG